MTAPSTPLTFLTAQVAVSPALTPERLRIAKALGFASVISAAPGPDTEDRGPAMANLAERVRACRMQYRSLCGNGGDTIDRATADCFLKAVAELPKPVLVSCQTGEYSVRLWAAAVFDVTPGSDVISAAARAGFDLTDLINDRSIPDQRAA